MRPLSVFLFLIFLSACGSSSDSSVSAESTSIIEEDQAQFLVANAARDSVIVTDSGLQYEVLQAAEGAKPNQTDSVTVHYKGNLTDGTEFDSSYSRGKPASFALNRVITGWTEGVQLMSVGSIFKFVIPPELAYGEQGAGRSVGPNAVLVFEVELLSIN